MNKLSTPWNAIDRRPGYQRQAESDANTPWHCECGALVQKRFGEWHHVGPCAITTTGDSNESSKHI